MSNKNTNAYRNKLTYIKQYNKEKYSNFMVRFAKEGEADLLAHLTAQPNKQGYIKGLIAKDLADKNG